MSWMPARLPVPPLELRRWSEADLSDLMAAIEVSVEDLGQWFPWAADGVPSPAAERSVPDSGVVDFDRDAEWSYSLIESSSGELFGGCGLHRGADLTASRSATGSAVTGIVVALRRQRPGA